MRKSNVMIVIVVISSFLPIYVPSVKAVRYLPFTVGDNDTPQNIDPANAWNSISYDTLNQVYEGLYVYNLTSPDMEPIPQLASKMGTWNENLDELTIELRQDVTFHDGSPFDADVVKWNFDRLFYFVENEMNELYARYLNNDGNLIVKETLVVDEFTIKFVLNKPWIVWESMLAFTGSYIIKPNENFATKFLALNDPAIGTGPFKLVEIEPDVSVEFERFEDYYKGPANISSMVYTIISDGEVASTAMLNHELHYGGVISDHLDDAEADPDITIERIKTTLVFYLQMSVLDIPYEVRRAMAFAYNYPYYLEETLQGEAYELHTPIPAGMQYNNESIEGLPYFNKTIARQYMLSCPNITDFQGLTIDSPDADWRAVVESGTPLFAVNFTRYTSIGLEKILVQCIDNYADIGVKVVDWHYSYSPWLEWSQDPAYDVLSRISLGGWAPDYNDAITMIEPIYKTNATYNIAGLADTELDALIAENYELTGDNRSESFDAIVEKLMVDICPSFYLYQRGGREVYNNRYVSNIQDMLNAFDNTYWYKVRYTPQEYKYNFKYTISEETLLTLRIVGLVAVSLVLLVVWKRHSTRTFFRGY